MSVLHKERKMKRKYYILSNILDYYYFNITSFQIQKTAWIYLKMNLKKIKN